MNGDVERVEDSLQSEEVRERIEAMASRFEAVAEGFLAHAQEISREAAELATDRASWPPAAGSTRCATKARSTPGPTRPGHGWWRCR